MVPRLRLVAALGLLCMLVNSAPAFAQFERRTTESAFRSVSFNRACDVEAREVTPCAAPLRTQGARQARAFVIRVHGGLIIGHSTIPFTGFIGGGGVAFPLAGREDMELQIDVLFSKYSGGPDTDDFSTIELSGTSVTPTVVFLYNFIRQNQRVIPFVGGGLVLGRYKEVETETIDFFGFTSVTTFTTRGWLFGPHGVAGLTIPGSGPAKFRIEGRFGFSLGGALVVLMAGVSF